MLENSFANSPGARKRLMILAAAGVTAGLLAACLTAPVLADITIVGRYKLVNGDTLTRPAYYTPSRVRVTGPDGREFVYDGKLKTIMVINHAKHTYWRGPIEQADTIATRMLYESNKALRAKVEANKDKWIAVMDTFNNSVISQKTEERRKIAGYACTKWILKTGRYLDHERWVARGLDLANYAPELEKVVMASMLDPFGRVLMRQLIALRSADGIPLASSTAYQTPTQHGSFSWEAIRVESNTVTGNVWDPPKGYQQIHI